MSASDLFHRWLGMRCGVPCPMCENFFSTKFVDHWTNRKWPIVGLCGHSICCDCHQAAFAHLPEGVHECPIESCPSKKSFNTYPCRSMHNLALRSGLDRWEDIQEAAKTEIKKFEIMANEKLEEQRKRFHDDRVELHSQIDDLEQSNDKLANKVKFLQEQLDKKSKEEKPVPSWRKKRKVSVDTAEPSYYSDTSEEEFK